MVARETSHGTGGPGRASRWDVPWAGWRAVVDVVVVYVGALLLAAVFGSLTVLMFGGGGDAAPAGLVLLSPVALLIVAVIWLRARYGADARAVFGPTRPSAADVGIGVGVGLACFVVGRLLLIGLVALLTSLGIDVPAVQDTFRVIAQDRATAPALVLTAVVLAPLSEEVLFRGVLFQGVRARTGFWRAAVASAGMFTVAHVGDGGGPVADLIIVAGILPLGLAFAAVMQWRGNVLACAVGHAVYNAGGVALLILMSGAASA